jgi:hypothetical protein
LEEEFSDKVGLLGTNGVFFNMFGRWPDYAYDDKFGVKIMFKKDGITKEVLLNADELASVEQRKAPDLFYVLEQKFREKLKER